MTTIENGVEVKKNIGLIGSGDFVRTLIDGELKWTKVLKNTKTEGFFEFVQISAQGKDALNNAQLIVTPSHGLVFLSEDGNRLTLDSAEHVMRGDLLIAANGDVLHVTEVSSVKMQDKYTLETSDGTVLASDVFVSTICDEEVAGGERLWDTKMKDWHARHDPWFKKIFGIDKARFVANFNNTST